ncbi:MAG: acyloxyacyl hydrolase, partial [Comamonadaceae bacterium]
MPFATSLRPLLLAAAAVAVAAPAAAQGLRPSAAYVQAGGGDDGVHAAASVGAIWDWDWRRPALGGEFSGSTELVGTLLQA